MPIELGRTGDSNSRGGGGEFGDLCLPDCSPISLSCHYSFADLLAHEAQFVVNIGNVRGVMDTSVFDPEPGPEGPFISYNYYVTYDFVEDLETVRNVFASALGETQRGSVLTEVCPACPGKQTGPHTGLWAFMCIQSSFLGPSKIFFNTESYPSSKQGPSFCLIAPSPGGGESQEAHFLSL